MSTPLTHTTSSLSLQFMLRVSVSTIRYLRPRPEYVTPRECEFVPRDDEVLVGVSPDFMCRRNMSRV